MSAFITPFLASSVTVALTTINTDFSVPDQALLLWVTLGFMLSAAVFIVPFSRIADIHGRKTIYVAGLSVVVLSSFLCTISNSIYMLIASRVVEGFGSALIFGTAIAILTAAYPAKERGKVLGINVAITYTGLSLGPFLGGIITQTIGWRYIYGAIMVYTLVVAVLAQWKIKDNERCAQNGKFDIGGSGFYGVALFLLILGFSLMPAIWGFLLLVISIIFIAAFFRWELRHENPILKISVFRKNTVFLFSNFAAMINYCATAAIALLISLYLQDIKLFTPETAGLILIAQPIVQALFSPLTGRLSDRIEPRYLATAGMGLCVVGLGLFALLTPATSLIIVIAALMFVGLGFALFSSPNTNAIMSSVDRCDYSVASGMVSTMRLIGQMMSSGIALLIFSLVMGHTDISPGQPGLMSSIQVSFVVFALLCIVGMGCSIARGNLRKVEAPIPARVPQQGH
jgi:MFS family permease